MAHTNGMESFWALLKREQHGTFHKMSVKHLHRYVKNLPGGIKFGRPTRLNKWHSWLKASWGSGYHIGIWWHNWVTM